MIQFIAGLYGVFATIPFISFFIVLLIAFIITKDKKESLKWSVHISMLFLLSAVAAMFDKITGSFAGFWWITLLLLFFGGLLIWLQWKVRQRILLTRVIRSVWLLGFLVLSFTYVILFFVGIIHYYGQT